VGGSSLENKKGEDESRQAAQASGAGL